MQEIHDILVPSFVHQVLAKSHCEQCEQSLEDAWIRSAGIRLDEENAGCFFATVWCKGCEKRRDILFTSYHFCREEWWQDVACWVGDAARPDRVHLVLSNLKSVPHVQILFRKRGAVRRVHLVGAYEGDAGPVLFIYHKFSNYPSKSYGVMRLERGNRLRLLTTGEREALPISRWLWFAELPADMPFHFRKQEWRKLSVDRLRKIVQDRVFEPWLGRGGRRRKQ